MADKRRGLVTPCVGLALALLAVASRAALRARSMTTFDVGLFGMGVLDYDVPSGQPHPPGYALIIVLARLLHVVLADPVQSLVWLSILASGAAAWLIHRVAWRLAGAWAGALAGLVFVLSPLAVYNGAVGLSYAGEALSSALLGLACWWAGQDPTRRRLAWVGLAFAFALGIRPSSLFVLSPLLLWPVLQPAPWSEKFRRAAVVAAVAVPATLAWLLPALHWGGGTRAFLAANRYQSDSVVFWDTVVQGGWRVVPRNLGHLAEYAEGELKALPWLLAGVVGLWLAARGTEGRSVAARHGTFLALWGLPAFLFYAFVYVGWPVFPSGYLMVVLPAVAVGIGVLCGDLGPRALHRPAAAGMACAALLVSGAVLAAGWPHATEPIREADDWGRSWTGFDEAFPSDETAVLTFGSWFYLKLEEPEHVAFVNVLYRGTDGADHATVLVTQHRDDEPRYFPLIESETGQPVEARPKHPIPPWIERIAIHEGHPFMGDYDVLADGVATHNTTLSSGRVVRWFVPEPGSAIEDYIRRID